MSCGKTNYLLHSGYGCTALPVSFAVLLTYALLTEQTSSTGHTTWKADCSKADENLMKRYSIEQIKIIIQM